MRQFFTVFLLKGLDAFEGITKCSDNVYILVSSNLQILSGFVAFA